MKGRLPLTNIIGSVWPKVPMVFIGKNKTIIWSWILVPPILGIAMVLDHHIVYGTFVVFVFVMLP